MSGSSGVREGATTRKPDLAGRVTFLRNKGRTPSSCRRIKHFRPPRIVSTTPKPAADGQSFRRQSSLPRPGHLAFRGLATSVTRSVTSRHWLPEPPRPRLRHPAGGAPWCRQIRPPLRLAPRPALRGHRLSAARERSRIRFVAPQDGYGHESPDDSNHTRRDGVVTVRGPPLGLLQLLRRSKGSGASPATGEAGSARRIGGDAGRPPCRRPSRPRSLPKAIRRSWEDQAPSPPASKRAS